MRKNKVYALYKGDNFIDIGTRKELADKMGVGERTISFYSSPTYQKRNPDGNCYIVIECEDEEEKMVDSLV